VSIFTGIIEAVTGLFKPATELLDTITTTDEERGELKNRALELKVELSRIQSGVLEKLISYESQLLEAQTSIVTAEAKSESGLTRMWRPIAMLTFLAVILYTGVVSPIFGTPPADFSKVPNKLWDALMWGLGGYVIGRSVEKSAANIVEMFKKKEAA